MYIPAGLLWDVWNASSYSQLPNYPMIHMKIELIAANRLRVITESYRKERVVD